MQCLIYGGASASSDRATIILRASRGIPISQLSKTIYLCNFQCEARDSVTQSREFVTVRVESRQPYGWVRWRFAINVCITDPKTNACIANVHQNTIFCDDLYTVKGCVRQSPIYWLIYLDRSLYVCDC